MNYIIIEDRNTEIEEIEKLIHNNELKLYKTASTILNCEDDINEAIQKTIILVYKNINKLRKKENFTAWMLKILVNESKKIWNQNKTKNQKNISFDNSIEIIEKEKEDYSFIKDIIEKLDKEYKEVTILYYYDELTIKEISKILNIPQGTVKSRLSRAREKIKKMISKETNYEKSMEK